jgi:glycosyltransferase involved in cell wall biosynthesis
MKTNSPHDPLSICVAASFAFPGETGSPVLQMQSTLALAEAGHSIFVIRYAGWRGVRSRRTSWNGIDVYQVPLIAVAPTLVALVVRRHPVVVDAHGLLGAKLGAIVSVLGRCPLVIEFHEIQPRLPPPHVRGLRRLAHRTLAWLVVKRVRAVVTLSRSQQAKAVAEHWAPSDAVPVIYPPVDEEFFTDKPLPLRTEAPVITYAGNFMTWQGVDLLIDAMTEVWSDRPDAIAQFWGASPDERTALESAHPDPRLHFSGRLPIDQMPSVLQGADVLVIPRPDHPANSTTGRKLGEYLASGRPLVATDVADHSFLLEPTNAALVVAPNAAAIAAGILATINSPEEAVDRARRGLDVAREHFSRPAATTQRIHLLRTTITRAPRHRKRRP